MGIEFFKPDDFASSDDCRLFRFEVARKSNKLLSQNLPRLYEALGMKRVYFDKNNPSEKITIPTSLQRTRFSSDTHTFWMTEPEPLEEEKVECENYWHLLTHMIKATENKYGYSLLKHDSCPSCGQKLTEGEE